MKGLKISITIQTDEFDEEVLLTIAEARELWEKLGVLFGDKHGLPNYPAGCRDFDPIPPVTCADTGRTVWATDGAGNPISPDELKARNRERSDKWAEIGEKFAAEAKPDYYTDDESGIWQEFKGSFESRWLKTGENRFVMMTGKKVHSLCWGNPYKSCGIRQRWDCVNGFTE